MTLVTISPLVMIIDEIVTGKTPNKLEALFDKILTSVSNKNRVVIIFDDVKGWNPQAAQEAWVPMFENIRG